MDGVNCLKAAEPLLGDSLLVTTKTIKLGKVVSYYNRPPPIKSDEPLNMWSFEITCQIENVLSPLPQCLKQPKLAMW